MDEPTWEAHLLRSRLNVAAYFLFGLIAFLAGSWLSHTTSAQTSGDASDLRDRITIQERLLYAYAYTYDSKDCASWANLFTTDAILTLAAPRVTGRDAMLQWCIARQKNVVGNIETHHYMTNIVFDELTASEAKTRTYVVLTWQKPGDMSPSTVTAGTYQDLIVKQNDGRWVFKEREGHFNLAQSK